MKILLNFLFLIAVLAFANCSEDYDEPFMITTETEYAVYRALIEGLYVDNDIKLIVIESKTVLDFELRPYTAARAVFYNTSDKPLDLVVSLNTFNSFQNRNRQSETLDCTKLALSVPCKILDRQDVQQFFSRGDREFETPMSQWLLFYEIYPGAQGIMQLSKIGFDTEGRQALVYVGNQAFDTAGAGFYIVLVRKDDNTWVIRDISELWIS